MREVALLRLQLMRILAGVNEYAAPEEDEMGAGGGRRSPPGLLRQGFGTRPSTLGYVWIRDTKVLILSIPPQKLSQWKGITKGCIYLVVIMNKNAEKRKIWRFFPTKFLGF